MVPAIPLATYRLQLTSQFGFDQTAQIVPYLKTLGISHLYVSPILKARAGSTHGYDVVDHNAINPELGGEEGLRRLTDALSAADLGLILDFVPNHMGVHYADNAWWLDVLEWGPRSPYADYFDIDWALLAHRPAGGVLIPILRVPYGEALENGDIELRYDPAEGSFSAWYYEHRLPISPTRYSEIINRVVTQSDATHTPAGRDLLALAAHYQGAHNPSRQQAPALKAALASIPGGRNIIECGLAAYRPKAGGAPAIAALHHLLERQNYRVAHWRLSGSDINYRRFFDVNSLAGLRVEDTAVFSAIHRVIAHLIAEGRLQGLRLDHIDGLRDPQQYLQRLQRLTNSVWRPRHPRARFYVIVEKILAEGEQLPRFAGVVGTTGYEWLNTISHVLADSHGLAALKRTWQDFSDDRRSFDAVLIDSKRRVLATILSSEFTVLGRLLDRIAAGHYSTRDYTAERLRAALELFILHFPVYRTYVTAEGPSDVDRRIIDSAIAKAREEWVGSDGDIFTLLRDALTLDLIKPPRAGHSSARVRRFAFKVQQFTGPMMAKSLEDTAFYRYQRLLAFNEVGGNPAADALSVADFHATMARRAVAWPRGLTATATHDTKRGEDARARILALTELAEEWAYTAEAWRALNAPLVREGRKRCPSRQHEYMLYQALLGVWPSTDIDSTFIERLQAYALKAAREGKDETSWVMLDERYEAGLTAFVTAILDQERSARFLNAFAPFARRIALLGALNSLSQLVLKLTLPGVPDFYQGTEFWDFALVDPDNRRPVDFLARAMALSALGDRPDWDTLALSWMDARIKLAVMRTALSLRQRLPAVFTGGGYRPLDVAGRDCDEVVAFARVLDRDAVIITVGRLFARASDGGRNWPRADTWEASIDIGDFSPLHDALTGECVKARGTLALATLFKSLPVALIHAETRKT